MPHTDDRIGGVHGEPEKRLVRIPMPVALIREMDEALVAGLGGFSTREEFVSEAVRDKLMELSYPPAQPGPGESDTHADVKAAGADGDGELVPRAVTRIALEDTVLRAPARPVTVIGGGLDVADSVVLGLHNRDYTSIWALARIAELAADGPVEMRACVEEVVRAAWAFAEALPDPGAGGFKLDALFPKNRAKAQSASDQFRNFAIGAVRSRDGSAYADGPLFTWRALQGERDDGRITIALTAEGRRLLDGLDGLSLVLPHAEEHATFFLAYLEHNAPADFAALRLAVDGARSRLTRVELVEAFSRAYPDWTQAQATTNAQGYVARGREWGLIEPKLVDRRYHTTELGERFLRGELADHPAGEVVA